MTHVTAETLEFLSDLQDAVDRITEGMDHGVELSERTLNVLRTSTEALADIASAIDTGLLV